jgi:hypothetical protein
VNSPGFYRVDFDGERGIGCCKHGQSAYISGDQKYEVWTLLVLAAAEREFYPVTTTTNSLRRSFSALKVGKKIRGLPTDFAVKEH